MHYHFMDQKQHTRYSRCKCLFADLYQQDRLHVGFSLLHILILCVNLTLRSLDQKQSFFREQEQISLDELRASMRKGFRMLYLGRLSLSILHNCFRSV